MYLLDTNHCGQIIKNDPVVINKVSEVGELNVATCVIVQGELIYMAENSQQKQRNKIFVHNFLRDIRTYFVDEETANLYGEFKAELIQYFGPNEKAKRRKTQLSNIGISDNDLWIAAIALRHNLILISADHDFQRMQAVRPFPLETWWQPSK